MADETKDSPASGASAVSPVAVASDGAQTVATDAPAKKHPKGVILGKDGKP